MSLGSRFSSQVFVFALALAGFAGLSVSVSAQENSGYVQDWSTRHVVFSNPGSEKRALEEGTYDKWWKITNDQRFIMQDLRRNADHGRGKGKKKPSLTRDWSMNSGAQTLASQVLTVGTPGIGTVTSSSTVTVDAQVFTGSGVAATQPITVGSTLPADGTSITIGGVAYSFSGSNLPGSVPSGCEIYTGGSSSATTVAGFLYDALTLSGTQGQHAYRCASGANSTVSAPAPSTPTITLSEGPSYATPSVGTTGITLGTATTGSAGTNSASTFSIVTKSGSNYLYVTANQLAEQLATNFSENTTVTSVITVEYTLGGAITLENDTTASKATSVSAFTGLTGTGTLAASTAVSTMQPNTYPAKYSLLTTSAPTCTDFIVYPTGAVGGAGSTAGKATVIGYDNLYLTTCSASPPSVEFAYNTGSGATVGLSPVLSQDGTQIAYIQVSSSVASLVLLKPTAGLSANKTATCSVITSSKNITCTSAVFTQATLGAPITNAGLAANTYISSITDTSHAVLSANPTTAETNQTFVIDAPTLTTPATLAAQASAAAYTTCTAPCFYAIALSGNPNDTNSEPFYTYNSGVGDTIFVGDDSGRVHKFTGVFKGTPAEAGGSWPAIVSTQTNKVLTSPVYDGGASQLVFVGDSSGYLYSVGSGSTPGIVLQSAQLECGSYGFVEGPMVDSVTEFVYTFSGDGCATKDSYVNQFAAGTSISASSGTAADLGNASTSDPLTVQYQGTFDNTYYGGSGNTGNLYACVNGTVFQIPMSSFGSTVNTFATEATTTNDAAACSPVTEFYNSPTDYLFVSLAANGVTVGGTSCVGGCIYNFSLPSSGTTGSPSDALQSTTGATGVIVDNSGGGTGESQVYYMTLSNQACVGNGTVGSGTGTCAVQASQSALQ